MGNNWSESIVNGSDPKYTWAQTTPTQQVAWQVQKPLLTMETSQRDYFDAGEDRGWFRFVDDS